ncbi:MAG TPA: phage portal protein [Candidatus Binatia bacterium]|nr:phage portal protein [Candidatus Binatia bacterium]
MNAIERAIAVVSPQRALRRVQARHAIEAMDGTSSGYSGGKSTRINSEWFPTLNSADKDTLQDLDVLRARSRSLLRENGWAEGLVSTLVDHVVGLGIKPQAKVDAKLAGISPEEKREYEAAAESAFKLWVPHADITLKLDFYELQQLSARSKFTDGEYFHRIVHLDELRMQQRGAAYSTALEIIDPDRVKSPRGNVEQLGNGNVIKHGIEFDRFGAPVAFWVLKTHPNDIGGFARGYSEDDFIRVPASSMVHGFDVLRPGQTRGVPLLAPVLNTFHQQSRLATFHLVAAQVAACYSLWITSENPAGLLGATDTTLNAKGQREEKIEPGVIRRARPGESIQAFSPNHPHTSFFELAQFNSREISSAAGVTYEQAFKDFTKTTFSGGRLAQLVSQKFYKRQQGREARVLGQRIYTEVIREAWLAEDLPVRMSMKSAKARHFFMANWAGPAYGYVDPVKEVQASRMAIAAGLSTHARECAATGEDWEEVFEQLQKEQQRAAELGLKLEVAGELIITEPHEPAPSDDGDTEDEDERDESERDLDRVEKAA